MLEELVAPPVPLALELEPEAELVPELLEALPPPWPMVPPSVLTEQLSIGLFGAHLLAQSSQTHASSARKNELVPGVMHAATQVASPLHDERHVCAAMQSVSVPHDAF